MAAFDAQRTFTVVELQRTAQGTYVETPVKFIWDARTQSSPRHGWEYGVRLRTVREDYPGSDEPVEQVLGTNFEPFEIRGIWDDRYAGEGFAESQRVEFEKLVQRGNLCRLTFETITITGLLTQFVPTYYTSWRVAYKFTVSPHFRVEGGDTRRGRLLAPKTADPTASLLAVNAVIDDALVKMQSAPASRISGSTFSTVASSVGDWSARADSINVIVSSRVLAPEGPINSLSRVVQSFSDLQSSAAALLVSLAGLRSDQDLAYEDAMGSLGFDEWVRGLAFSARQMIISCAEARRDLGVLVDPKARAIYRPRQGESLYAISNRFYGTPFKWQAIAERNNLRGFTLTGQELLVIPDVKSV
jgi:hypothetical protein